MFENKGLKLLSLVLAVFSWYGVRKAINFEVVVTEIPLVIHVDEGWAILDRSAERVDVLFRGSREAIQALNRDHMSVEVDLRGEAHEESSQFQLDPKHVRSMGNARAVQIQPERLSLRLDKEGEKPVPVKVTIEGEPMSGYAVEKTVCSPASTVVYGPLVRLEDIDAVWTSPVDLNGRSASFKSRMSILSPSTAWVAHTKPEHVLVEVTIAKQSLTQELKDVPIRALVAPGIDASRLTFNPSKVAVVVSGPSEVISRGQLSADDAHAYVDCVGLASSASYELPVQCDVPSGLWIHKIRPSIIEVETGEL